MDEPLRDVATLLACSRSKERRSWTAAPSPTQTLLPKKANKNKEFAAGAWLLLGTDSLVACIAVGPIMSRRMSVLVPFALLFGVADGLGYLLGCALHWSYPDSWNNFAPTVVALLGAYWIVVAILSKRAAKAEDNPKVRWGV